MHAICGLRLREVDAGPGLRAMLAALAPDGLDAAEWTDGAVGLGSRSGETERPSTDPGLYRDRNAGLTATVDARLDNRDALCDALGVPHPDRVGLADGDLILRSYLQWGRECPNHLIGDYAFAVWDARTRTFFCARDHIGARPFYYAETVQGFAFASSVDVVLAAPGVSDEFGEAVVARALTRAGLDEAERTFFRDVRKLPLGHSLTFEVNAAERSAPRLARYWQPEHAAAVRRLSDDDYAEEFLCLYGQAVAARVRGAAPVGVHLSGGLDSSGIAVLAARELRRSGRPPPLAFSWLPDLAGKPPDEAYAPEYERIDAVCRQEGLTVFHRAPNAEDMVRVLRLDGARPGVHVLASEEVVQRCAAERGVRVLLSGWGGDQGASFNGRGHRAHLLLSARWGRLLALGRARGSGPLRALADAALPLLHPDARRGLRRLLRRPAHGRQGDFSDGPWLQRWLAHPAFARRHGVEPKRRRRVVTMRQAMLWGLNNGALVERIEGWAAGGARHGIEYRYPLLDRRLLEFALGLPPEQFLRGEWNRWLMRHALRGVLPASILWNRSKNDPARFDPMFDAFADALPLVRQRLEMRAAPPSRARYVDLPRLLERLDADRFRAEPRWASIQAALQFLDF